MFSFIAFSETWLDEYKQGLTFKCRHDLEYFDGEMETMLIEIEGGGGVILNAASSLGHYIEYPMLVLMF